MHRLLRTILLLGAATGCAIGPRYRSPQPALPSDWRPAGPVADSLRPFFDSLTAERDTLPLTPGVNSALYDLDTVASTAQNDTTSDLAWFDLLRDPELRLLVETALRDNRDVRIAIASVNEFRAQYRSVRGDFFPQIGLNGQTGRTKTVLGSIGSFSYNQFQVTADLSWELDFWGRIRRSTEAARSDLLAQREARRTVSLALIGDVATAYLLLRQLDLQLEIASRTLTANRETFRLAKRRFDEGLISELDVRQFESEVANPAASVAQLEGQVAQAENLLSILLGRNPGGIRRGRPLTEVLNELALPRAIPASLLTRRPDVRQADAELHAATARIGVAQGDLWPRVMITGDYGSFSQNTDNLFRRNSEIYQLLGGVSIPLFTGGKVGRQVDVARARAEQSRFNYDRVMLTALREVEDALAGIRSSRNETAARQTQVDALRRALRLAEMRYESGSSSYLDLLDAQRGLFDAEMTMAEVLGRQATAAVTLYKALGGGWPAAPAMDRANPGW